MVIRMRLPLTDRQKVLYEKLAADMQRQYEAYQIVKRSHDVFLETLAGGTDWPEGTNISVRNGELVGESRSRDVGNRDISG